MPLPRLLRWRRAHLGQRRAAAHDLLVERHRCGRRQDQPCAHRHRPGDHGGLCRREGHPHRDREARPAREHPGAGQLGGPGYTVDVAPDGDDTPTLRFRSDTPGSGSDKQIAISGAPAVQHLRIRGWYQRHRRPAGDITDLTGTGETDDAYKQTAEGVGQEHLEVAWRTRGARGRRAAGAGVRHGGSGGKGPRRPFRGRVDALRALHRQLRETRPAGPPGQERDHPRHGGPRLRIGVAGVQLRRRRPEGQAKDRTPSPGPVAAPVRGRLRQGHQPAVPARTSRPRSASWCAATATST